MAWTAKIKEKSLHNERITVDVEYTNGERTFILKHSSEVGDDGRWLERQVFDRKKALESLDATNSQIVKGQEVGLTHPAFPIPPEREEFLAWKNKVNKYRQRKALVDLGIYTKSEIDLDTLKQEIKAGVTKNPNLIDM